MREINKIKFKEENKKNWENNTEFWLTHNLRHVEDTQFFFKEKLKTIVQSEMFIVDMGCGSGWLLDFLLELKVEFSYLGLDFNPNFIEHLRSKYSTLANASFEIIDFELEIPRKFWHCADLVFNCFNFFETANLDVAFENAVRMLKNDGTLEILTIEYAFLILALSHNMDEFKSNLTLYEEIKSKGEIPYFFQNIDLGNSESKDLKYASVLYSFADFYKQALKYNLKLHNYEEVIKTSKFIPKTYQYIEFKRV